MPVTIRGYVTCAICNGAKQIPVDVDQTDLTIQDILDSAEAAADADGWVDSGSGATCCPACAPKLDAIHDELPALSTAIATKLKKLDPLGGPIPIGSGGDIKRDK